MSKNKDKTNEKENLKINDMELYRNLRTRIHISKNDAKIISIVSNDIEDGKSQIAYSLAESYAKTGKRVLLVDGNLRNPQLSANVNLDLNNGLSKLLKENANIQNAFIKIGSENLYLLPTQKAISDSTELLESELLTSILNEIKKIFDLIIIDTLAINVGMDALIISKLCDGVVYITVENKTKENELKENKIIFEEAGINIIGAVLVHSS